jgi:hypothetical protein
MKTQSIHIFHQKLEKQIKLVAEHCHQRKLLTWAIPACRLRPIEFYTKEWNWNLNFYRWWVDEWGNSLKVLGARELRIVPYDTELRKVRLTSSDLYEQLSAAQLLRISRKLLILTGKEEDLQTDHYLLVFYGLDGYLRAHSYLHGEWQIVPPLLLGKPIWQKIFEGLEQEDQEMQYGEMVLFPCTQQKVWLISCPLNKEIRTVIGQNKMLVSYLDIEGE